MRPALLCCLALGCAAQGPVVPAAPTRLVAVPRPAFDPKAFAADQLTPADCEEAARRIHDQARDDGWSALRGCVERTRWPRGEFTQLERLTGGFWDSELQTRPDAPQLVARIIALRGGDVEGDIPLAQKSRVPVFSLAAALRQPDLYRGRWVLVRGALSELKQDGGRAAALLHETSLRATAREVQVGSLSRSETSSRTSIQAEARTSRLGDGRGSAQISSTQRSESSTVRQKFENERVETGRQAVGKLAQADPFLEPDKDFLFLARFDGVRPGEEEQPVAVLSIAGYFQPNALLIQ